MNVRSLAPALAAVLAGASCLPPQEDPTTIADLRVLGASFEPPEILIPGCNPALLAGLAGAADGGSVSLDPRLALAIVLAAGRPLSYKALIADPQGFGRSLDYRVLGCARTGDRDCNEEGETVELSSGKTAAGELALTVAPGLQFLPGDGGGQLGDAGTPLLLEVINNDTWRGLGGIRVPVVLDLKAKSTTEHIYAQKLMVYSCQFFPEQKANVTPVLPGVTFNGEPWAEGEVKEWVGEEPVTFEPVDFSALEEPYIVASLSLQPVKLTESWRINWMTTWGTMSSFATGGSDPSGTVGRHRSKWQPVKGAVTPIDVTFTFVVRDGRGGMSWLTRRAHWSPG